MNEDPPERHDEAEENYFVSLSDLMTGVVFIFVILLCAFAFHYQTEARAAKTAAERSSVLEVEAQTASSAAQIEKVNAERSKLAAYKAEAEADKAKADAEKKGAKIDALSKLLRERDEALKAILSGLVDKLTERGVRVLFDPATGVIRLPEELLFAPANDTLSESGKKGLAVVAEELVPVLIRGCAEGSTFRLEALFVEGHTDADPIRSPRFSDNWDLSAARATNTYRALIEAKPELESFKNPSDLRVLGVSGYGENRPVAQNDTDENKKSNRRVDLRFLMAHPTDSDLDRARKEIDGTNPSPR
jgi:flagellar motor protein MotB